MILPGIAAIFKIISIVISSWVVIHLLAAFGVFIAFSYPIWWFIFPRKTFCLNCHARNKHDYCSLCRREIERDRHPEDLRSALLNSLLILVFSVLSFGLVYIEAQVIKNAEIFPSQKTVEFIIPDKQKYKLGEVFPMEIRLNGIKIPINAVQVDIGYDPQQLEVIELSTENSFATVFIQKEINNDIGFARLTGGLPNPGYQFESGLYGTVYFKGKEPGFATVDFLPTSVVLANDSKGTNVLKGLPSSSFLILAEAVNPESVVNQEQVYLNTNVLGDTAEEKQLHLYLSDQIKNSQQDDSSQSTQSEVLGESTTANESVGPLNTVIVVIEKVDNTIISIFTGIFDVLVSMLGFD